jgi:uncharacterized protein with HEPN domain
MRPDGGEAAYLWDMVEAAREALEFTRGYDRRRYLAERSTQRAVERLVEIIGEAARRLPDALREAHPEIPWRRMIGQRHVLAHDYDDIDHERIWDLVCTYLPALIAHLEPLLPPRAED